MRVSWQKRRGGAGALAGERLGGDMCGGGGSIGGKSERRRKRPQRLFMAKHRAWTDVNTWA